MGTSLSKIQDIVSEFRSLEMYDVTAVTEVIYKYVFLKAQVDLAMAYLMKTCLTSPKIIPMWKGTFGGFKQWVYNTFGISGRKAHYYIYIKNKIDDLNLEDKDNLPLLEKLVEIGWTRSFHVLRGSDDLKEVRKWVKVSEQTPSEANFKKAVSLYIRYGKSCSIQQIMDGGTPIVLPDESYVSEKVIYSVDFADHTGYDILMRAVSIARAREGREVGEGEAIKYIASHFISTTLPEGGDPLLAESLEAEMAIKAIEDMYGIKLAIVSEGKHVDQMG